MKKGFSLIELIFAIVIIGICIAAIPKIVNASLESDEVSYKQEYFYEIKEFYGLIRNLPFNTTNVYKDEYKQNSLLSQLVASCKTDVVTPLYNLSELSLINTNSRYERRTASGSSGSNLLLILGRASLNSININNALGQSLTYTFADPAKGSKVNKSYTLISQIPKNLYNLKNDLYADINGCPSAMSFTFPLKINDDSNKTFLSFDVFFNTFGRLDSIYSQYSMMTLDTTWQKTNEDKLKSYLSL